jgi:alcohol dehydrogenase class IV
MDFKNMGAKRVCVVTDANVAKLDAMKQVIEGLSREGIDFTVFERTMVEPKIARKSLTLLVAGTRHSDEKTVSKQLLLQNPTNLTPSLQSVVAA